MKLTIGFSPCPNDTFIFDALVNNKIDTGGIEFMAVLEDVETLNKWALDGKLDITKLSYGVLPQVLDEYILLNSGSALGKAVGPLLVASGHAVKTDVNNERIAVPGRHTTANLLFSMAYPRAQNKDYLRYDEIEDFVKEGKGLGVIIHENRFTYEQKGLVKLTDLGDYWERETGNPVPLGGIVIRRNIDKAIQRQVDGLVRASLLSAFEQYPLLNDFIRCHAQEMQEEVMRKHIELYVNDFSVNLGKAGRNAVMKLIEVYDRVNGTDTAGKTIFLDEGH